ncbi:MAG: hypothetical protein ACE5KZ_07365 [Candidatus Scalinduaceae bacterium]
MINLITSTSEVYGKSNNTAFKEYDDCLLGPTTKSRWGHFLYYPPQLTDFNLQIPANPLHLSIITGIMHKTITQL